MDNESSDIQRRLRIARFLIRCSQTFSVLVILTGVMVLVGYQQDIELLKRINPRAIAMNPLTAVCFILSGSALWILNKGEDNKYKKFAYYLATFVLISGAVQFISSVFSNGFGLDELLFYEKLDKDIPIIGLRNKMSPNTAFNFILSGLCLLLIDKKGKRFMRVFEAIVITVALIALLAIYGYIYEINYLYGIAKHIPMAVHTGGCFFILAMGIIFARPLKGMTAIFIEHGSGEKVFLQLIAFLVPLLFGWFEVQGVRKGYISQGFATAGFVIIVYIIQVIFLVRDVLLDHYLNKEREKTATIIRENERQLRSILQNLGEGVIVTDEKGAFLAFNPAAQEILGIEIPDDSITGWRKQYTVFYPDEETPFPLRDMPLEKALKGEPTDDIEMFIRNSRTLNGREILATGRAIRDEQGKIRAGVVVFRDITDRRKLEKMLEENEKRLRAVIANIGEGVVVADKNGTFLLFNKKAEEILNIGAVEGGFEAWQKSYGVFYADGITPFPGTEMPLAKAVQGIATDHVEMVVKNSYFPEGKTILVTGRPIKDEKGNITAGVVDFQDITEKKKLERSLDEIQRKYVELLNNKRC